MNYIRLIIQKLDYSILHKIMSETIVDTQTLYELCWNESDDSINIIKSNFDKLTMESLSILCKNPNNEVIEIIKNNWNLLDNRCKINLCYNTNEKILEVIIEKHNEIPNCYDTLCLNTNNQILEYVKDNIDKLTVEGWKNLCVNENFKAIQIILNNKDIVLNNLDQEGWNDLMYWGNNNEVLEFISEHLDKLDYNCWEILCLNSAPYNVNDKLLELLSNNADKLTNKCWISLCNYIYYYKSNNRIITNLLIDNKNKLTDVCINLLSKSNNPIILNMLNDFNTNY